MGIAGYALQVKFLKAYGNTRSESISILTLSKTIYFLVSILLLIIFTAITGSSLNISTTFVEDFPRLGTYLFVTLSILFIADIAFNIHLARKTYDTLLKFWNAFINNLKKMIAKRPRVFPLLIISPVFSKAGDAIALLLVVYAFGGSLSFAEAMTVVLGGSLLASPAPTPGKIGVVEPIMAFALVAFGVSKEIAFSSVFAYRFATFWVPLIPGYFANKRIKQFVDSD